MKRFYIPRLIILTAILLGWNWSAYAQTSTYNYTGNVQSFTVPAGIISLTITATGAQGGSSTTGSFAGGVGAVVTGYLTSCWRRPDTRYYGRGDTRECYKKCRRRRRHLCMDPIR